MSMVPMSYRNWWDDFGVPRPSRLFDTRLGLSTKRDDFLKSLDDFPQHRILANRYYRPWGQSLGLHDPGAIITSNQDKFEVILDVQQFAPYEITVKTNDNVITVEAKHREKRDSHGYIAREFIRTYTLPDSHDVGRVVSNLSSDGILTISAPKRAPIRTYGEKFIPIRHTGRAITAN